VESSGEDRQRLLQRLLVGNESWAVEHDMSYDGQGEGDVDDEQEAQGGKHC
jgi:hypothetical protein